MSITEHYNYGVSVKNDTTTYSYGFTCSCGEWHRDHTKHNTTVECECGECHEIIVAEKIKQCTKCGEYHNSNNPPLCFGCAMGLK